MLAWAAAGRSRTLALAFAFTFAFGAIVALLLLSFLLASLQPTA